MLAVFQNDAIDHRLQLSQRIRLRTVGHRLADANNGHLDLQLGEFVDGDRRKARIAEGGGQGIGLQIISQRAMCLERTNTTA